MFTVMLVASFESCLDLTLYHDALMAIHCPYVSSFCCSLCCDCHYLLVVYVVMPLLLMFLELVGSVGAPASNEVLVHDVELMDLLIA